MKVAMGLVVGALLLGLTMPVSASNESQDSNSPEELAHALAILDTIMSDSDDDALAHELRGDVYAQMGLTEKARVEHDTATALSKGQSDLLSRN